MASILLAIVARSESDNTGLTRTLALISAVVRRSVTARSLSRDDDDLERAGVRCDRRARVHDGRLGWPWLQRNWGLDEGCSASRGHEARRGERRNQISRGAVVADADVATGRRRACVGPEEDLIYRPGLAVAGVGQNDDVSCIERRAPGSAVRRVRCLTFSRTILIVAP